MMLNIVIDILTVNKYFPEQEHVLYVHICWVITLFTSK